MTREALWIIGPGRLGSALASLLREAGWSVELSGRELIGPDQPWGVVITVPDGVIGVVAEQLAEGGLPRGTPVLHTSGVTPVGVLEPLACLGCPVGGLHPLATATSPDALRDVWWGIEASGAALALAERIVGAARGQPLSIPPGGRALYHAAAVLASNALVALLAVAERVLDQAGVENGRNALVALAGGALRSVAEMGAVNALTGPISRGDVDTVRAHLARLSAEDRAIYCALGREALGLARQRRLHPQAATALENLLGEAA